LLVAVPTFLLLKILLLFFFNKILIWWQIAALWRSIFKEINQMFFNFFNLGFKSQNY
jgi:hypothetical protein